MNGLFFTDNINECLNSKAFIAHIAPVSNKLDYPLAELIWFENYV